MSTFNLEATYSTNGKCTGTTSANGNCQITVDIPQTVQPPILVVYTLMGAYINHARYINSIDPIQLQGRKIVIQEKL